MALGQNKYFSFCVFVAEIFLKQRDQHYDRINNFRFVCLGQIVQQKIYKAVESNDSKSRNMCRTYRIDVSVSMGP